MDLLKPSDRIYVAGHQGLVGSAIWRALQTGGYSNLIGEASSALDLRDHEATEAYIATHKPDVIVLAAAKVATVDFVVVAVICGRPVRGETPCLSCPK
jgi:GDP-L-fucose synthase